MVHRRWVPLELALGTGIYDFSQALLSLAVSLLLLLGIIGLTPLLRQGVRRDISAE